MQQPSETAFLRGYHDGRTGEAALTPRKVQARYPDLSYLDVSAYLNGHADARIGDTYRVRLVRARVLERAVSGPIGPVDQD